LKLTDASADPIVGNLTLTEARDRLTLGLAKLPTPPDLAPAIRAPGVARPTLWRLVLDNDGAYGRAQRPLAPLTMAEVIAEYWAAQQPLEEVVKPLPLDELTVAEDPAAFFDRVQHQPNLPDEYKQLLPTLYVG
jgi:hypothetical protein